MFIVEARVPAYDRDNYEKELFYFETLEKAQEWIDNCGWWILNPHLVEAK